MSIILNSILYSQTSGISYQKAYDKPFETYNNSHSIRWNMNHISTTLGIDTNKITFYYNNDYDWQFLVYGTFMDGQIFEKYSPANDAINRYDNINDFRKYNTLVKDSSSQGYNFMPIHVTVDSIANLKTLISLCDHSNSNEIQSLSLSGQSLTISSGNTIIIPTQITQTLTGANNFSITTGTNSFTLTQYIPTTYTASRSINSGTFQVSSTKNAQITYNIKISCTATIGGAADGKVLLQYSINGGSTWIDVNEIENSNTVTLALTLNAVTIQTSSIVGDIPAGAICRLVPTTSGTTTITYIRGFEKY